MNMTYEQAVEIVKSFGQGSVTLGMQWMKMEVQVVDDDGCPLWLTDRQADAYYLIKRENSKR